MLGTTGTACRWRRRGRGGRCLRAVGHSAASSSSAAGRPREMGNFHIDCRHIVRENISCFAGRHGKAERFLFLCWEPTYWVRRFQAALQSYSFVFLVRMVVFRTQFGIDVFGSLLK